MVPRALVSRARSAVVVNQADLLARIDRVLARGKETVESIPAPKPGEHYVLDHQWVKDDLATGFRIAGLALLESFYGRDHQFYKDFVALTAGHNTVPYYRKARALIEAVREEVDLDWYQNTRALIAAAIFFDVLEMAE